MTNSPDMIVLLQERMPAVLLDVLHRASALATERGLPLYVVGGVVRDLLLGRPHLDTDLTVVGDAIVLAQALAAEVGGQAVLHPQFGTARVIWNGLGLDVVTARAENYSRPGALPVVRPGDLRDDLLRRDFSINALAVRLDGPFWGELVDLTDGLSDLGRGVVRVLHDRSFLDDPTRIFRAVRYEQRLGFHLDPDTEALLRRDVAAVVTVSADRLRREIFLMLEEAQPERALLRAQELGLLAAVHPALRLTGQTAAVFTAARQRLAPDVPGPKLYLCLALAAATVEERTAISQRLMLPGDLAGALAGLGRVQAALPILAAAGTLPSAVTRLLDGCDDAALEAVALTSDCTRVQERITCYRRTWRAVRPFLSGQDIQDLGVPRGPEVGALLHRLRAARLDGQAHTREDELALVREWLPIPHGTEELNDANP